jgi:hypothetical protein
MTKRTYVARWWEGGTKRKRTFDRKKDRDAFTSERLRRQALGDTPLPTPDITLAEMVEVYWQAYAVPQLAPQPRDSYAACGTTISAPRWAATGSGSSPRWSSASTSATCAAAAPRTRRSARP